MFFPVIKNQIESKKLLVFSFFYLFLHLNLINGFRYFSNYGFRHELYVEQLIDWKCKGLAHELAPSYPSSIVPGGGHNFIFKGIKWLEPDVCKS